MVRPTTLLPALLMFAAAPALAQGPSQGMPGPMMMNPIVTLSVTESVDSAPDKATINTGVETRALSAKQAMAQNATQVDALVKALLAQGIERKDIQTSGINLNPQYDYSQRKEGEGPRFVGYTANNNLTVIVRKLDKAGEIVDAMVNAGATNINGPQFGISDTSKLEAQARDKAIKTAQERAAAYARAAGYSSARLIAISETGDLDRPMPPMPMLRMEKADITVSGSRVEPGQLSSSITLGFRYMLER